jgi:scyllo-inositol 2-dehydrogenase (NAD+)
MQVSGAVVGCGRMGAQGSEFARRFAPACWIPLSHGEAMASHERVSLRAVCDLDPAALAQASARFGVSAYSDFRRMVDEIAPGILGIATRTPERPEIIRYALENGVRALHIEKPLCNSVAQLLELEARLLASPALCTYGTLRRYFPLFRRARELVTSGEFGRLRQIQVCFGAAPLLWTHPHSIDVILFMAGDARVRRVTAQFDAGDWTAHGMSIDGDPIIRAACIEFENGLSGLIGQNGGWDVLLSCSEGTIAIEADGHRVRARRATAEGPYWSDVAVRMGEQSAAGHGGTMLALDRLLQGMHDKQAILAGQRVLFACAQSHLQGGAGVNPEQLHTDVAVNGRTNDRYA